MTLYSGAFFPSPNSWLNNSSAAESSCLLSTVGNAIVNRGDFAKKARVEAKKLQQEMAVILSEAGI